MALDLDLDMDMAAGPECPVAVGAVQAPPTPSDSLLEAILALSTAPHHHLCPRQVLGARMALAAGELLGLELPRTDKRMLAVVETDGCFVSGIEAAANLHVNRRTLRVVDYGRIAATFADLKTETAWRLAPAQDVRVRASDRAPPGVSRFAGMMQGYRSMPTEDLLTWSPVAMTPSAGVLSGRPHVRVDCAGCGEEVINLRETWREDRAYCPACVSGAPYYRPLD